MSNLYYLNYLLSIGAGDHDREAGPGPRHQGPGAPRAGPGRLLHQPRPLLRLHVLQVINTLSFFLLFFLITPVILFSRRQTSKASAGSLLHAWDVVIKFYEMKASLTSCCRSCC